MPSYLLFQLFGPLAAWGDIAVGERRHVYAQPTKSAVLGLVAGAVGLRRTDEAELAALHEGYGFASRVDSSGVLLTDFHTAQTPPEKRGRTYRTRREELAGRRSELGTILSYRDYHTDAYAIACLWSRGNAPYTVAELALALRQPVFIPYLGRRSCSPALPFSPVTLEAYSPVEALRTVAIPVFLPPRRAGTSRSYFWEGDQPDILSTSQSFRRRDIPRSRIQWQFAERTEHHAVEEVRNETEQD